MPARNTPRPETPPAAATRADRTARPRLPGAAGLSAAVVAAGIALVVALNRDLPDLAVPAGAWAPGAALDGRAFDLAARVAGTGKTLPPDTFSFAGGRFQSARCQAYCDIGWQEYRTRQVDGVTHFTATTQCPDAPHTFVWHGTVDGDMLRVEGSWTTRRWYWTQQIRFAGEGRPAAGPAGG